MSEKKYKWGFHVEQLAKAAEETRGILIDVARSGGTISYTDLCRKIKTISLEPDSHALAHVLGLVSAGEDRKGNGMLSVLVVYRGSSDFRPGPGFFNLARDLGYNLPDKETEEVFWIKQSKKVYEQWGRRRRPGR